MAGPYTVTAINDIPLSDNIDDLLTGKRGRVGGGPQRYEAIVQGSNALGAGRPVAFDVLCDEIKGLGLNITLEKVELEGGSIL